MFEGPTNAKDLLWKNNSPNPQKNLFNGKLSKCEENWQLEFCQVTFFLTFSGGHLLGPSVSQSLPRNTDPGAKNFGRKPIGRNGRN